MVMQWGRKSYLRSAEIEFFLFIASTNPESKISICYPKGLRASIRTTTTELA